VSHQRLQAPTAAAPQPIGLERTRRGQRDRPDRVFGSAALR